ncbi:CAP domain-containing protein [Dyadobacter fanqingshengii]|uniref:CAP domain-containing protein n=1 Tax=Dyadobacter fanqingshengii TaxID=2906443 RepID=A0A9X1T958_9BACT|nr:CAP domain-containing protein [Dyadobacter fanqingshengii]MCF0040371.1 CAP domain-containing protein [Dyadobacter fanqingshengii]USJ37885.1 CAP domain-containing protein [Dyadobacter fanqingshengii]
MARIFIVLYFLQPSFFQNELPGDYFQIDDKAFFPLPITSKTISLVEPDTLLLDAAIFHATNRVRREHGLQPFKHDVCLYKAAKNHAASMVLKRYYSHNNPFSPFEKTVDRRVDLCTKRFKRIGENIGRYQTLISGDYLLVKWDENDAQYNFIDPDKYSGAEPFTYAGYANHVASQWMSSYNHRQNILSGLYVEIGCAARLCREPYKVRRAPYASLVQNFGNEH